MAGRIIEYSAAPRRARRACRLRACVVLAVSVALIWKASWIAPSMFVLRRQAGQSEDRSEYFQLVSAFGKVSILFSSGEGTWEFPVQHRISASFLFGEGSCTPIIGSPEVQRDIGGLGVELEYGHHSPLTYKDQRGRDEKFAPNDLEYTGYALHVAYWVILLTLVSIYILVRRIQKEGNGTGIAPSKARERRRRCD